jgi:ATP-dependent exoDNAse (exonuclease V) beta subunit
VAELSIVLQAGAGTGKTHSLVELCVELLQGGLAPARLCAVTFTEKAAAELKGRLRLRIDALAESDPAFRRIRRDLGLAQVGTIHSLCAQILRRHAAAAPGFVQLDEEQARRLLRQSCEAAVLRALEAGSQGARRLCAEMGFRAQGKFASGLSEELAALLSAVGESGPLPAPPPLLDEKAARDALLAFEGEGKAARAALELLLDADAGARAARLAHDLVELASLAQARYRESKQRANALDFDDLTRLCRDLLARDEGARASERERIGALLVDEFQDTSRAQLELFDLLADKLVLVGDRKQSIYEFRGADLAAAQAFASRKLAAGAELRVLKESRRSLPALVELANLLFSGALADLPFTEDDALSAHRAATTGPCAEMLDVKGDDVDAEAEMVARRIAALLASGTRGGDVAILLRRTTNLDTFRRALLRQRIPHLVYKGRGFHEAREILDLVALLSAAVDPADALSRAAVLRSPLGPVSDDGLVLLASGGAGLAPDDAEAVQRLSQLLDLLEREIDRLGPAGLLELALARTDYVAACAGGLYGEQAAANIDKLLALARAAELRGESVRAFCASLRSRADEEARESEASVVEERDPHAVRILTVHAAKGLEFPVVFVPECATPSLRQGRPDRVLVDAELGLAVKVQAADGKARRWGPHGELLYQRKQARELRQSRRLFYVAVTRARDLVVLSGREAPSQESWRTWIDRVADEAVVRGLLRIVSDVAAPSRPAQPAPPPAAASEELRALLRRIERPPRAARPTISAPVTQIADASVCPRRYQLLHELRLEERPGAEPALPDPLGAETPATEQGTLAHRLLELAPWKAGREELRHLEGGEDPEVLDAVCAFLDSPLALRMAAAPAHRLHKELPFMLRLESDEAELLLRGQIDALLLDDGAATVVDYKLSQARDLERYSAQLDAYALAAHELVQGAVPVRTGIVFLRSRGAPFAERPPAQPARIRADLLRAAAAVAEGRRSGEWPKIDRTRCEQISCGFIHRCHGESPATSRSG